MINQTRQAGTVFRKKEMYALRITIYYVLLINGTFPTEGSVLDKLSLSLHPAQNGFTPFLLFLTEK